MGWLEWITTTKKDSLPPADLARQYITAIRRDFKPKTVNRKITAIRGYGRCIGEPLLVGYNAPTPMRATAHPLPEGMAGVERMIAAAATDEQRALVALCGLMGLRVAEALSVHVKDIDVQRRVLRVRGKGDKERVVPISAKAWEYLAPSVMKAFALGTGVVVPYADRSARKMITSCGKRAGLSRAVSSHDLRMTFGTEAYRKTKDLRVVQELLGHSSPLTTQGYTGISEDAMREAADL